MFSKFQKIGHFFKVKLLRLNLVGHSVRFCVNYKIWLTIISLIAIIIPCFIKVNALFTAQVLPKFNNSSFMFVECKGKGFIDSRHVYSIGRVPIIEIPKFRDKCGFELVNCFIESIAPGNVFTQEVGGKATNKHTRDCIQKTEEPFHYDVTSLDFFKGWLMGICFGLLVMDLYYHVTHNSVNKWNILHDIAIIALKRFHLFLYSHYICGKTHLAFSVLLIYITPLWKTRGNSDRILSYGLWIKFTMLCAIIITRIVPRKRTATGLSGT